MLIKHWDAFEDEQERWDFILGQITDQRPESLHLDYKETVDLNPKNRKARISIATDITSFANERGGMVIYGVPQHDPEDQDGQALPPTPDTEKLGHTPIQGFEETVNNFLDDVIRPRLPELRMGTIPLSGDSSKVLYVLWHPESWDIPHMVEGYGVKKYYRRSNYRSIEMSEHEVERAYQRRLARAQAAANFIQDTNFDDLDVAREHTIALLVVIVPNILTPELVKTGTPDFRKWLNENAPRDRVGDWKPFLGGVRFLSGLTASKDYPFRQFSLRVFKNAAISFLFNLDTVARLSDKRHYIKPEGLDWAINKTLLPFAKDFYNYTGQFGPMTVEVRFNIFQRLALKRDEMSDLKEAEDMHLHLDRKTTFSTSLGEIRDAPTEFFNKLMEPFYSIYGIWP